MSRIGPRLCICCGQPESNSGCVRGPVCGCDARRHCSYCLKCEKHCQCEQPDFCRDIWEAMNVRTARTLARLEAQETGK